jgi:nucleotide-binding universal stress UspA family protein
MDDKIVTIATHTYSRAQLIKGHLEARGIECFLSNINLIQSGISSGVKINVKEADIKRALEIIKSVKYESGTGKEDIVEKLKEVRKILVPIDFSAYSNRACAYALEMAKKLKAEVTLLHVYYDPAIISEPFGTSYTYQVKMDKYTREIEKDAKKQMEEFSKKLKRQLYKENIYNIRIVSKVIGGIIDDNIIDFCNVYQPGIVIMGTKGNTAKSNDVMGSVTSKIIDKVEVPVMAIPGRSSYKDLTEIKSILYATNFDESDFQAIRKLMTLIRPFNLMIHCIHVDFEHEDVWDKVKMKSMKEHFQNEYSEYNIKCGIIKSENILKGIQKYVEDNKIGIISLTTHKRNLFQKFFRPSVARQMLFHSNTPLLVFHS